jgi:signal transduction histidine kinase
MFRITEQDKDIIANEIKLGNLKRVLYITTLAIPIHLFHIISFWQQAGSGTAIEMAWKKGIIITHCCLLACNLVFSATGFYIRHKGKQSSPLADVLIKAVFLLLTLWGAATVALDQWVTTSIVAFFLTSVVSALVLLIRPLHALLYFGFSYLVYYVAISYTQASPEILLTNRVNGFGAIASCFGISSLLWTNTLLRLRQSRIIAQQQQELENNYQQLLVSAQELGKANSTKDKFFSIIAHDLRGPIHSTVQLTEMMQNGMFQSAAEQEQVQGMLYTNLLNTSRLLENLLTWSRSGSGAMPFSPVRLNLHACVSSNIELLQGAASAKHIVFRNEVAEHAEVHADAEMINTIIRNLLSNAIKFSRTHGSVSIQSTRRGNMAEVMIADNGTGIAPATLEKLFRIDAKITSTGTRGEKGTGLGLILCREFAEAHGGSIRAESELGKGSRFYFTVPAA